MNLKEHQEIKAQIEAETKATELELELKYKNSYYKNVDAIRKNIQFFFWITIIPMIIFILKFLIDISR